MASNPTNAEIAEALGVSMARASFMAKKLGMPRHSIEAARRWFQENVDPTRSVGQRSTRDAALPASPVADEAPGGSWAPSLADERARLARAQAEKVEMQNAIARGELAPIAALEVVLSRAGAKVAGILDAIPGMLRRRVPTLTAADLELVAQEIAKARNIAASVTLADLDDDPAQADAADEDGDQALVAFSRPDDEVQP